MRLRLPMQAVYWAPIKADSFGRPTQAAPVQLACRWEDQVVETIDRDGNIVYSSATVYLASPVLVGGYLFLGLLSSIGSGFGDPIQSNPGVHEIISLGSAPNLKASQILYQAMLK
jgi:hypothetical protein